MKGADESRRVQIVRTALEAIYAFTHFLAPAIPLAADAIFKKLNTAPVPTSSLRADFYNLVPGTTVTLGDILFTKIVDEESKAEASAAPVAVAANKPKKAATTAPAEPENPNQSDFSKIELRVGRITRIWHHETAERWGYCSNMYYIIIILMFPFYEKLIIVSSFYLLLVDSFARILMSGQRPEVLDQWFQD